MLSVRSALPQAFLDTCNVERNDLRLAKAREPSAVGVLMLRHDSFKRKIANPGANTINLKAMQYYRKNNLSLISLTI